LRACDATLRDPQGDSSENTNYHSIFLKELFLLDTRDREASGARTSSTGVLDAARRRVVEIGES
jgi:hypothetical protein